jgi:hypothetical protein
MSFGPKADPPEPRPDNSPAARVGTWAAQQAYQLGAEQAANDPDRGFALGHDVGFAADTSHAEFVHAVMDGYSAGAADRHELSQSLLDHAYAQSRAERDARQASAAPEAQTELEAEPG